MIRYSRIRFMRPLRRAGHVLAGEVQDRLADVKPFLAFGVGLEGRVRGVLKRLVDGEVHLHGVDQHRRAGVRAVAVLLEELVQLRDDVFLDLETDVLGAHARATVPGGEKDA